MKSVSCNRSSDLSIRACIRVISWDTTRERIAIRFSPTSCFFHSLGGILPLHPRLQQKHVMSLVALIDEVMQWLAGVMRIITIDANSPAVIYHFLKNVSCETGTEDEEVLLDPLLVDHDILCPKFILCCHQQVKRRLCICNHDLITANNCADGTVLLDFLYIHCFFPLQIPICLVLANPHPQHDCIRLSASFAGALNAEMLFQNPEDIVDGRFFELCLHSGIQNIFCETVAADLAA